MTETLNPSMDDFAQMLEASFAGGAEPVEGAVVKGRVVSLTDDFAVVDVGLKTEGRVPLKEFRKGDDVGVKIGDEIDVFVDRVENASGEAVLSREKAKREESWGVLEKAFEGDERVEGRIFSRVKGGFMVDLDGVAAFLPGSQVDIRPVRDVGPLMNIPQPFRILKMDRRKGNIVVSRRSVLEEARAEQREELVGKLAEGEVRDGVVKNITDYGAFVDLGGIDGLLHVTDMSWSRVNHPSQVVQVGQSVKVQIIKINMDSQRISLGMKQLEADPWDGVAAKYPIGAKFTGRVTNITDYGAFVELEAGVEGLIHVSEMSWTKKNVHPGKIISTSQEVEVMVLEVDSEKRRVSLGLKQVMANPWEAFAEKKPIGSVVEGEVRNITEFGLFIGLDEELDGMVHLSDLSWNEAGDVAIQRYSKGDVVKAKILDVDVDRERISLGVKQLDSDPMETLNALKRGMDVTCIVTEVASGGIEVRVGDENGPLAFIRKSEISRDHNEQRPERFAVGDKVDARVTNVDKGTRKVAVSIKAREMAEEKAAVEQYGSTDAGASLGDILGQALRDADEKTGA